MPTQEERLTTLEQNFAFYQREHAKRIREIQENEAITIGLVQTLGIDIKRISARQEVMSERLDSVDQQLGTIETRLDRVENLLGQILERLPKP